MLNNFFNKDKGFYAKHSIPLRYIFIIFVFFYVITLVYSCYDVLSLAENIDSVSVAIKSRANDLTGLSVHKVTPVGLICELKSAGDTWKSTKLGYFKKIWISFPKGKIKDIEEVQVNIGNKKYRFSGKDLSHFKSIPELELLKSDGKTETLEFPGFVMGKRSVFFSLILGDVINWGGDLTLLAVIIRKTILSLFCLLFLLVLISFSYPKIFHLCLVFLISLIVVGFFSTMQVDPHHDGIMLKPAIDVANGKMLFRDTFSQYGALTTILQASAIKLFGERLIVIRLLTVLFYGLISILLWLVYSRFLPRELSTFSCFIWLLLGYFFIDHPAMFISPWSTVFSVFLILFALYFLILFFEKQNRLLLFLAGIAASLVFWFKINYGVISFLSFFSLLIIINFFNNKKETFRALLIFLSGYFLTSAVFFIWLVVNGALADFILQTIKFAFVFSDHNKFSSSGFIITKLARCLLRINGISHVGATATWTILPVASAVVLVYSFFKFIKTRELLLADKIILSTSFISTWLWLGYYPINALFHMYLSSIFSVGLFIYLFWRVTTEATARKNRVSITMIIIFSIIFSVLLYDINSKISGGLKKISKIKKYERIETPDFLKGMHVSKEDKRVYTEIEKMMSKFPDYNLINLTNSGLYSLYKKNNNEFHKMYVYWGWDNAYLYPDYIPKLNKQILLRSSVILSADNLAVEGYVPLQVFPELNKGVDFGQQVVFLVPGELQNIFKISGIDYTPDGSCSLKLRLESSKPVIIDSIIARILSGHNIPKEIEEYDFDYDIMPRIFDRQDRDFIRRAYSFNKKTGRYSIPEIKDKNTLRRLLGIFSGLFLYDKYFYIADTFESSVNNKISIYLNKSPVGYKGVSPLGIKMSNNDIIDLVIRVDQISKERVIRLRINYNGNHYFEETAESI